MFLPEPISLAPAAGEFAAQLAPTHRVPGIYLLRAGGNPVHLSRTNDLERRLRRLFITSSRGELMAGKLDLIECWPAASKLDQHVLLYAAARKYFPEEYTKILRLRAPWFLALTNDRFPRLDAGNRLRGGQNCWGPFRTRAAAEQYEQEVAGLFQTRRCTEILTPFPDHPGCIYGEMNQCLRPCQQTVSDAEYSAEAARLRDFLRSNGRTAVAHLIGARDRASAEADFEQAAQIHKRIERLKNAASCREPVIEEIEGLGGVAVTRALHPDQVTLRPMLAGLWQEPICLNLHEERAEAQSLDSEIRALLSDRLKAPRTAGDRLEELAIFSRWFYSSWRDGEWFPFTSLANLNYRKLIREVSKVRHAHVR